MGRLADSIGRPALLEQLAEESVELAHAALKLARKLRGESPTPVDEESLTRNLMEEIADVDVMLSELAGTEIYDGEAVARMCNIKTRRWESRISEMNKDNDKDKT